MGERVQIGIIGGTGLYQMEGVSALREVAVETPFGKPSDSLMLGELEGRTVAFLPRHGRGHRILPHELNFQANVFAMKTARRRVPAVGLGGGLAQGGLRAARHV